MYRLVAVSEMWATGDVLPSLDRPGPELPGCPAQVAEAADEPFMSDIGGLLPIALWGRTVLLTCVDKRSVETWCYRVLAAYREPSVFACGQDDAVVDYSRAYFEATPPRLWSPAFLVYFRDTYGTVGGDFLNAPVGRSIKMDVWGRPVCAFSFKNSPSRLLSAVVRRCCRRR